MPKYLLKESQWKKIKDLLTGKPGDRGTISKDNRRFVEGVLWIGHTNTPWRKMDPFFGDYHVIYTRHLRWHKKGLWNRVLDSVADDSDLHALLSKGVRLRGQTLNLKKSK